MAINTQNAGYMYQKNRTRYPGVFDIVGNTPLLPLRHIPLKEGVNPAVQVLAKAEWFNPGGSVKDRPARQIIRTVVAEERLAPGQRMLDSTSGNMGIAYATFAAALNLPLTLAIPESASPERLKMLRALGAELILTDPGEGSDGAIREAQRLNEAHPERYLYLDQYNTPGNWQAHYHSTGPEILAQTGGRITHFVVGLGTSGTLTGAGRYLRAHLPDVQIISMQPDSPFHGLEGLKHMPTAIKPGIYDPYLANENLEVRTEDAYEMVRRLAREEGVFVGISSGAAAVAALRVARRLESGTVVTVFPDAGYKYLSDRLWEEGGE
jgi:cysteine synthase B